MAKILTVCVNAQKGAAKKPGSTITLIANHRVKGDAHAGNRHRQISLLAQESRTLMLEKGVPVNHGDFGENIVTRDISLKDLPAGTMAPGNSQAQSNSDRRQGMPHPLRHLCPGRELYHAPERFFC